MLVFVVGQKSSHYFPSDYIETFQHNVQALPAKNEVIVELQPYIENVLRADDPKFWEKLRFEIILSLDKKFLTNDLKLKLISQKGP